MTIREFCNREVVFTTRDTSIPQAARLMRDHHVGNLVIVEKEAGVRRPVGIVTDRDIVVEVLAKDVPLDSVTVGDIMSHDLLLGEEEDGLWTTIQRMRSRGIRRIPVVNAEGGLEGILTVDDIFELLSEELAMLVRLIAHEQEREQEIRG